MLTRIISGAVGVVILAVVLFFHNTIVLPIAVAAMIAVMLYELLRAVKMEKCLSIFIVSEICGISMPFLYNLMYCWESLEKDGETVRVRNIEVTVFLAAFVIALFAVFVIFVIWLKKHKEIRYEQVFFTLAVMILVSQSMSTMVKIDRMDENNGLFLLIIALCGAWIADTGAYFTGVAIGKHKLCPEISPKKTIEGFIGGIVTTGIVFAAAFAVYSDKFSILSAVALFIAGAVCAVVGTIGDLSASMVKRQIGCKDYGKIMPGHGGLMGRFDSVLFVLPTFYAFLLISDLTGHSLI